MLRKAATASFSYRLHIYTLVVRCGKAGIYPKECAYLIRPPSRPSLHYAVLVYQEYFPWFDVLYNLETCVWESRCFSGDRPTVLASADNKRRISEPVPR